VRLVDASKRLPGESHADYMARCACIAQTAARQTRSPLSAMIDEMLKASGFERLPYQRHAALPARDR
jgi:hypothetical protein